jgi:hypothetical protein
VLSQHLAKTIQSHPRVPLQILIVRCSLSCVRHVSHVCFIRRTSLFLTEASSWTGVRVVNGCSLRKVIFHQLGEYGFQRVINYPPLTQRVADRQVLISTPLVHLRILRLEPVTIRSLQAGTGSLVTPPVFTIKLQAGRHGCRALTFNVARNLYRILEDVKFIVAFYCTNSFVFLFALLKESLCWSCLADIVPVQNSENVWMERS